MTSLPSAVLLFSTLKWGICRRLLSCVFCNLQLFSFAFLKSLLSSLPTKAKVFGRPSAVSFKVLRLSVVRLHKTMHGYCQVWVVHNAFSDWGHSEKDLRQTQRSVGSQFATFTVPVPPTLVTQWKDEGGQELTFHYDVFKTLSSNPTIISAQTRTFSILPAAVSSLPIHFHSVL